MTTERLLATYYEIKAQQAYLATEIEKATKAAERTEEAYKTALEARHVITTVAMQTQELLEVQLATIVTMALEAVFPDPYVFRIHFEEKRQQIEAVLMLEKNGEECSPMDAVGGGVLDVCSFALRVAALMMQQGEKVIILDEPFKHLSSDLQRKASEMLEMLRDKLGVQFIMVTHEDELFDCADKRFTIVQGREVDAR